MIFSSTFAGVDQSMRRSTRKPRLNQDENRWTKVVVDGGEIVAMVHRVEQLLAHAHQRGGAAGREIEPAEQLLPARLGRAMKLGGRGVASGRARQAATAASSRAWSGPNRCASASKKAMRGPVFSSA